jgi:DNA mismatch endonuclease (patch repair protein)
VSDNLTPAQRSYSMSRIRSRGNSSTELKLIALMRGAGISGWRRRSKLQGRPDFVFPRCRMAVFVDGCYWHGCRRCSLNSKSNTDYWKPKIAANVKRDRSNTRALGADGWTVVRIWEHDLRIRPMKCLAKIMSALKPSK